MRGSIKALAFRLTKRPVVSIPETCVGEAHNASPELPRWKRVLDLTCILLASPVLLPLMALVAIFIMASSRGPVLFRQPRVGYRGRLFNCLKFRSMTVGADTAVHERHWRQLVESNIPMVKMDATDSRLIRGGRLLRASGLDELPQILNVLRGEMSLVGPRPCLLSEHKCYSPPYRRRVNTLPGLTGLWQVCGKNQTTFEEMIQLDIHYARHKSLGTDLRIMFRTFLAVAAQVRQTRTKTQPDVTAAWRTVEPAATEQVERQVV
jgi:exopolysaccharide production protein ExoY